MSSCTLKLLFHLSNGRIITELTDWICDSSDVRGYEKSDEKEREKEKVKDRDGKM